MDNQYDADRFRDNLRKTTTSGETFSVVQNIVMATIKVDDKIKLWELIIDIFYYDNNHMRAQILESFLRYIPINTTLDIIPPQSTIDKLCILATKDDPRVIVMTLQLLMLLPITSTAIGNYIYISYIISMEKPMYFLELNEVYPLFIKYIINYLKIHDPNRKEIYLEDLKNLLKRCPSIYHEIYESVMDK